MTGDEAAARRWFMRIVGALTYILLGIGVLAWWLGPVLLRYEGAFAVDSAVIVLLFLVLWILVFPFFLLVGYSIEVVLESLGFDAGEI